MNSFDPRSFVLRVAHKGQTRIGGHAHTMSTRTTHRQAADERSRTAVEMVGRELRQARRQLGLSQQAIAVASETTRSKVSRVERTKDPGLSIADATAMLEAVGLDLSLKAYPGGEPARDAAHTALLERIHALLHPTLRWDTEVPLPIPGDRRAWDAFIRGDGWRAGVEAETHADDRQALERKVNLKVRDAGVSCVLVVLARTAANRRFIEANAVALQRRFPAGTRETLMALGDGRRPPDDAILLL
jgi:transcriptional regulator with XRE-family HTH domain